MGKVSGQKKVTSRKDPLLPTSNAGTPGSDRCGACSRFVLLMLPILACGFVLGSLYLLIYSLGVSITEVSISSCLADYSPKVEILVLVFIGATLMFIVTAMRDIQISVYHRRQKSESKFMSALNLAAAMSNILGYTGFVILAVFEHDGPGQAPLIHNIGAFMFFILCGLYGLLHFFLLCNQTQYPIFTKIIFFILPAAEISCSVIWLINMEAQAWEYEWYAVAMASIKVGLFSILFLVDPVDDELRDFFCCRVGRGQSHQNSRSKSLR